MVPIDFHNIYFFHNMEVSGDQQLFGYQLLQNSLFYVPHKKESPTALIFWLIFVLNWVLIWLTNVWLFFCFYHAFRSHSPVTFVPIWRHIWTGRWSWTLRRTAIIILTKLVQVTVSPSALISSCTNSPTSMRGRVEEEVDGLSPGQRWKGGTPQDLAGVF